MAFQRPSGSGAVPGGGDGQNRRSILQELQQARSRLQRMQRDEPVNPQNVKLPGVRPSHLPGPLQSAKQGSPQPIGGTPPQLPGQSENSYAATSTSKFVLQQAQAQSPAYFISQPSSYGNPILPVLPRFDDSREHLLTL
eukprot:Em0011g1053a